MARRQQSKHGGPSAAAEGLAAAARDPRPSDTPPVSDSLRRGLLGAATALLVARPLVPSDGGPWVGDGQGFAALWIIVAALWTVGALGQRRFAVRFGWLDAAMLAFVGWWSASALLAFHHAAPRPSINMLWEGVAAFAAFFLLRQLVAHAAEARAMVAAMIGVAAALAAGAFYQYFVMMPEVRALLASDPAAAMRQAGVEPLPLDSRDFKYFADRLNSPEPLATFALTNSLAAFLAPWLVMTLGIAAIARWRRELLRRQRLAIAACALPIAGALLLTHSRSAWIGAAVGAALLCLWGWSARRCPSSGGSDASANDKRPPLAPAGRPGFAAEARPTNRRSLFGLPRPLALFAIALTVVAIAIIASLAFFQPELFHRATHSFSFRLDYWRATLHMIRDNPWFGCGPGNFKEAYTLYKLPTAIEEITDPHNFLFEVAACGGLPALFFLLALLGGFFRRVSRRSTPDSSPSAETGIWWILGGAALGFWLALGWNSAFDLVFNFSAGGGEGFVATLGALLVAGGVVALLLPWIRRGALPPRLFGIGAAVLLVALLAVGGITFAGVAGTLWILVALGLNATDRATFHESLHRVTGGLLLAALVAAGIVQYQTGYQPVLACHAAMEIARGNASAENKPAEEVALESAAAADPLAVEPRRLLAQFWLEKWRDSGPPQKRDRKDLDKYKEWIVQALAADPRAAELWHQAGDGWREAFEGADRNREEYVHAALTASRRGAELYPTHPAVQLELAEALADSGDLPAAREAAKKALRLDNALPADDRRLAPDQRERAEQLTQPSNPPTAGPPATKPPAGPKPNAH